jgi:hypothetical protein
MLKYISFCSLIVLILIQCITPTAQIKREKKPQDSFLPQQLYPLYLGMPMKEFAEIKKDKALHIGSGIMDFRIEKKEVYADKLVESVIYYFDAESNYPLYEFIIYFHKDIDIKQYVKERYGITQSSETYCFDSGEGFTILVWYFENTLVIAGQLAGTEWESGPGIMIK